MSTNIANNQINFVEFFKKGHAVLDFLKNNPSIQASSSKSVDIESRSTREEFFAMDSRIEATMLNHASASINGTKVDEKDFMLFLTGLFQARLESTQRETLGGYQTVYEKLNNNCVDEFFNNIKRILQGVPVQTNNNKRKKSGGEQVRTINLSKDHKEKIIGVANDLLAVAECLGQMRRRAKNILDELGEQASDYVKNTLNKISMGGFGLWFSQLTSKFGSE